MSTWFVASSSRLFATGDGGTRWRSTYIKQWRGGNIWSLTFSSAKVGVADVGGSPLYRTEDGGLTWSTIPLSAVTHSASATVDDFPTSGPVGPFGGSWRSLPAHVALPAGAEVTGLSCPSATSCVAIDNHGRAATFDGRSWSPGRTVDGAALEGVSCAPMLCAAVDGQGDVIVRRQGEWSSPQAALPGGAEDVSCSGGSCVAVGRSGAAVLGPKGWAGHELPGVALDEGSCTGRAFCLALGPDGVAEVYDGRGWSPAPPSVPAGARPLELMAESCGEPTFCVVVEPEGRVSFFLGNGWVTSTSPGWGSGALPFDPVEVSCYGPTLCAAANRDSVVSVLSMAGWLGPSVVGASRAPIFTSCPGPGACIALDGTGSTYRYMTAEGAQGASER